ncbi:MAG: efflux RND transporter periplasmic adaptor subunit [Oligoflexia bacterium]|nr:efflux RND transporter periplasmic adaptor subunit [Oligoflexia bacterium]
MTRFLAAGARAGLTLVQVLVPLAIILGGFLAAAALLSLRPEAAQAPVEDVAAPVEVLTVRVAPAVVHVTGTGTVVADQQVVLTPQVGGRITSVSDDLRPGSRVKRGQILARIDPRDFEFAITQAQSQVAQAKLNLELEQSRAQVAGREWGLVGEGKSPDDAPLALRGPQVVAAQQGLASAQAALGVAKLGLERSVLRAPFDAIVLSEGVDVGQVVGVGTQVATLVGSQRLRVDVQIPVEEVSGLMVPGVDADRQGSVATVTQRLTLGGAGSQSVVRQGHVIGLGGEIDAATRTATVLVQVEDPLGDGTGLPLLPGAFVDVEIAGRLVPDMIALPRAAVRDGSIAWAVELGDGGAHLARRDLSIGWRETDRIFIRAGLSDGEQVVTSPLSLPIEGMSVRVLDSAAAPTVVEAGK